MKVWFDKFKWPVSYLCMCTTLIPHISITIKIFMHRFIEIFLLTCESQWVAILSVLFLHRKIIKMTSEKIKIICESSFLASGYSDSEV